MSREGKGSTGSSHVPRHWQEQHRIQTLASLLWHNITCSGGQEWQETKLPFDLWHQSGATAALRHWGFPPRRCWAMQGIRSRQGKAAVPAPAAGRTQHFTRSWRAQEGSAPVWEKIPLSTSKQGTRLADNLNPFFPPDSDLLPSPRRWQSPAGSNCLRTRDSGAGPGTDGSPAGAEPRARNRRLTAPPAPHPPAEPDRAEERHRGEGRQPPHRIPPLGPAGG